MIAIVREQLEQKITQCTEALRDLKRYREMAPLEYLREHPDLYFAICFRFISAIESLFDAAQYVLVDKGLRAEGQGDIPTLLGKAGVIPQDLAERVGQMCGFRNRLVHAYGTLDDAKVAEYLAEHLHDIEDVLAALSKNSGA